MDGGWGEMLRPIAAASAAGDRPGPRGGVGEATIPGYMGCGEVARRGGGC